MFNEDANFRSIEDVSKAIWKKNRGSRSCVNRRDKDAREDEMDSPEEKLNLKVNCVNALWKLAKGNLLNSMQVVETGE